MTDQLPDALTHQDCDLRDFAFMPLDVIRLRDSDLAATTTGDEFRSAVLLWCASWHQMPAASLPDDDMVLAQLAGYGRVVKEWKKVRAGALRGWIKCSDGRLHHPVIAEKAGEAWNAKLKQRWMTECSRIKKHNQRHQTEIFVPDFDEWLSLGCPQGQVLSVPKDKPPLSPPSPSGNPLQGTGILTGTGTDLKAKASDSNESGGEPPVDQFGSGNSPKPKITDPNEIIFGYGVPLLMAAGSTEKNARSFLGGLRKNHGDTALIDKLRICITDKPLQPIEWLAAALPPPSGKALRHSGFQKTNYREGLNDAGSI